MKKLILLTLTLTAALLLADSAVADSETPSGQSSQHMSQLGPGDSVSIQIFGQPDTTNVYVGDDGTISVPLVGPVPVAGVSPVEAAGRVSAALKKGGFYVDPHVTIIITQSRSQLVSVVGEVAAPGRYPITPRTTIVELLAQAGGLKEGASTEGYVLRTDAQGHVTKFPISLTGLVDIKDALPTPTLLGDDSLVVPKAPRIYVYGEVASPGVYRLEPGMTVLQAVARAGGINERGSERRMELKRLLKDGKYSISRAKPGDPVQAEDIIRVKESIF